MLSLNKKRLFGILLCLAVMLGLMLGMSATTYAEGNVAKIGSTEYASLQEAINAAQSGDTITLLSDAEASNYININKSLTLDGDGNSLVSSASRGIRVTVGNVEVTIKNLTIPADPNMERAIQVDSNQSNVSLKLDNVKATATYYTVNICGSVSNLKLDINNCELTGWGAVNLWGANGTVKITNSALTGINDWPYDADGWNNFGTVVVEGDTTGQTTEHAAAYNISIKNSKIEAKETTGNYQSALVFNKPSASNTINIENTEFALANNLLVYDNLNSNELYIKGGKFADDPVSPTDYMAKKEADGTWIVAPAVTITFNANYGETSATTTQIVGKKIIATALNENSFNPPEGKIFDKWNTETNGSGTSYADKAEVTLNNDLTLYAQWKWQYATSAMVTANNRTYDRTESPLVTISGEAKGGTMYYALGDNETTAPEFDGTSGASDRKWRTAIPTATDIGTYYVWYKVVGDETHSDTEAKCVKVGIAAPAPTPSGGGDSGSGDDSGTSYTIPVTNESTVRVDVSIIGGNAAVNEISTDDISRITTGDVSTIGGEEHKPAGSIVVDLSGAPVKVSSVELTKSSVENLAEAVSNGENLESIKLVLTDVAIELDQKTLETMASVAQGNSIRLVVDDVEQTKLNDKQQDALKTFVSAEPFEVYFESNGQRISDFGGGSMAIALKFTPAAGKDPENYFIAYLNPDGSVTLYPSTVKNGTIFTVLDHNSEYAVVYDDSRDKAHARKVTIKSVRAMKGKKAQVKWKNLKDINGYQIAYSTSKKFTKKTTKKVTVGVKATKKTIKKLKAGRKYYVKVRSFNKIYDPAKGKEVNVYGKWSKIKKVKVK